MVSRGPRNPNNESDPERGNLDFEIQRQRPITSGKPDAGAFMNHSNKSNRREQLNQQRL